MTVDAFDRAVFVSDALVVAGRCHAIMGADLLVAAGEGLFFRGAEVTEGCRQAVAAMMERRAAKRPERILQPFGQSNEAFAAENDMAVLKAGPGEPEVIEQMIERPASNRDAEAAHVGKIR